VKFQTFSHYLLALMAALLLAACGGGGAGRNPNEGGPISVSPESGTFYAGMPSMMSVSGGRAPYSLTSSEPGILPVPPIVNVNQFFVVPNNPGVVDVGLQPGQLPVRTVIISVRDSTGILVTSTIKVAQNFLTGYSMSFGASTCPANPPCRGGETAVIFDTTTNGSLVGLRKYRLEAVRGPFKFVDPLSTNNTSSVITVDADHEGKITAVIRADGGVPSQVSIIRVTDVVSGASTERSFVITATSATTSLTLLPETLSFTGATATQCGTGTSDVLVLDGQGTITPIFANPGIIVTPVTPSGPIARFRVTAGDAVNCMTKEPVLFQDSTGARATLTITTTKGPAATPPPTMTVSPSTLTLACGTTGSVTAVGGSGNYSAASTHPRVTAVVVGNRVDITRLNGEPAATVYPTSAVVTVTDGATVKDVTVTITGTTPSGACT
jgi:hypothetical protein